MVEAAAQAVHDQQEQQGKGEQGKDGKGEPKQASAQQAQQAKGEPKKDQNYDKTAAALLDREKALRQQRTPVVRAARGSGPPVDKDW